MYEFHPWKTKKAKKGLELVIIIGIVFDGTILMSG